MTEPVSNELAEQVGNLECHPVISGISRWIDCHRWGLDRNGTTGKRAGVLLCIQLNSVTLRPP